MQPTLFITRRSAKRIGNQFLNTKRGFSSIIVKLVSRLNEDTKEYERGYTVQLNSRHHSAFL